MANLSENDHSGSEGNSSGTETILVINCILNAPLILMSSIGNVLVLAAILRTPSLSSPSISLLCSLAVSDLLVGFVVQPVYITYRLTENASLYKVLSVMAFSACGVSLFTITAISVDRFLALYYHMRYPNLMTTQRALYTSATLWLTSFLLSLFSFWQMNAYYFAMGFSIFICLLISTTCYTRIYCIVRHHQLQIHVQQLAVEAFNSENNQNVERSTKSATNTFIYFIVLILCYTPFFIHMSILFISPHQWISALYLTDTLAFMNSSINPFLYCWRLGALRTAVIKTARQILCKKTDDN